MKGVPDSCCLRIGIGTVGNEQINGEGMGGRKHAVVPETFVLHRGINKNTAEASSRGVCGSEGIRIKSDILWKACVFVWVEGSDLGRCSRE